ncbi:MAG: N-acetylglucosamine-6-sulfatase, partial [Gaiellaceae bacterium]|nr:N-acetylglucosamine-6-sulfatase [Gaiellaceae bacterium]
KEYGRDIVIEDSPGAAHFSALRTQHYLYVEYDSGARELYDLLHDPDELVNLYGDPAHAGLQAALARRLASLRACKGAGCKVGPPAVFTVRSPLGSGGCLRGPLALRVRGARSLSAVTFTIGGRPVGTEARAPFRLVVPRLRLPHGVIRLRARVSTGADQLVTLDRTARFC